MSDKHNLTSDQVRALVRMGYAAGLNEAAALSAAAIMGAPTGPGRPAFPEDAAQIIADAAEFAER